MLQRHGTRINGVSGLRHGVDKLYAYWPYTYALVLGVCRWWPVEARARVVAQPVHAWPLIVRFPPTPPPPPPSGLAATVAPHTGVRTATEMLVTPYTASVSSSTSPAAASRDESTEAQPNSTAQNPPNPDHAWFMGFAPAEKPRIVVGVFVEYGEHGYVAARIATKVMERYLKAATAPVVTTE